MAELMSMLCQMFSTCHHLQIFWLIIKTISILMVNQLTFWHWLTGHQFPNIYGAQNPSLVSHFYIGAFVIVFVAPDANRANSINNILDVPESESAAIRLSRRLFPIAIIRAVNTFGFTMLEFLPTLRACMQWHVNMITLEIQL